MATANELWSKRQWHRGHSAHREWLVLNADSEAQAVSVSPIAQAGSTYPNEASLVAGEPSTVTAGGPRNYYVSIDYGILEPGQQGGGEDIVYPPPFWNLNPKQITETVDHDAYGLPIVNSAGLAFQSNPSREYISYNLVAQWVHIVYEIGMATAFSNTINAAPVFIPTVGMIPAGWLKCECIVPTAPTIDPTVLFYDVQFNFELKVPIPNSFAADERNGVSPFDYRVVDQGAWGWYQESGAFKRGKFYDTAGQNEIGDVCLDGNGKPMEPEYVTVTKQRKTPTAGPGKLPPGVKIEHRANTTYLWYPSLPRADFSLLGVFGA